MISCSVYKNYNVPNINSTVTKIYFFLQLLNQLFVYTLAGKGGDLHGKHGAAGWGHRRGVSSGGDETGSVDSNVQMPHLSVCADSHKVDRTKLAQSEVRNEKIT